MRYPRAAAGAHDGFERGNETASWNLKADAARFGTVVDVGFAVGNHDDLSARQLVCESKRQRLRRPLDIGGIHPPPQRVELIERLLNLLAHRTERDCWTGLGSTGSQVVYRLTNGRHPPAHQHERDKAGQSSARKRRRHHAGQRGHARSRHARWRGEDQWHHPERQRGG